MPIRVSFAPPTPIQLARRPALPPRCPHPHQATRSARRHPAPRLSAQTPLPELPESSGRRRHAASLARIVSGLWQFSRPHTVYGTTLSVISLTLVAILAASPPLSPSPVSFLTALVPALLINVYIVGLNQLFDVAIDRVNKPHLPLASGRMTRADARAVVAVALVAGLAFCFVPAATPALRVVLLGSTLMGTVYSMPPFRLKRFPLLASIAILSVRGLLINLSFFRHAIRFANVSPSALALVLCTTAFFVVFGVIIALMKDVPDIRGDRLYGIRTFSVRLGASSVFAICVRMLCGLFAVAALYHFVLSKSTVGVVNALLHVAIAIALWWRAQRVDTDRPACITAYYMLLWKAFYMEYLLLPLTLL